VHDTPSSSAHFVSAGSGTDWSVHSLPFQAAHPTRSPAHDGTTKPGPSPLVDSAATAAGAVTAAFRTSATNAGRLNSLVFVIAVLSETSDGPGVSGWRRGHRCPVSTTDVGHSICTVVVRRYSPLEVTAQVPRKRDPVWASFTDKRSIGPVRPAPSVGGVPPGVRKVAAMTPPRGEDGRPSNTQR